MIRMVLEMTNRNEIRKAHEIVDKVDSIYEREVLRKFLPPRPEVTFRETIEELKGLASEDDMNLWVIIRQLERLEESHAQTHASKGEGLPIKDAPEGSLAARKGEIAVWRKGVHFWHSTGADLLLEDEKMAELGFELLRWGLGND